MGGYYSSSFGFWFLSSVMMFSSRSRRVMVVSGSEKYLSKVLYSMISQIMKYVFKYIQTQHIKYNHNKGDLMMYLNMFSYRI